MIAFPMDYEIEGEFARTDRAIVYRGRDKNTSDLMALKLVQNDHDGWHEVEMLERVSAANPGGPVHVGHFLGCQGDGHDLWIALEYFNQTLDSLDPGKMTPLALMNIALDSAKGLVEMERAGIVDDDVKPANLAFKARSGRVAHIDLGCARLAGEKPVGYTADFVAPEVLRGESSDSSPCYGWARTMEFICTGRVGLGPDYWLDEAVPWVGRDFAEVVVQCADSDPIRRPITPVLYESVKWVVQQRRKCVHCRATVFTNSPCPRCGVR